MHRPWCGAHRALAIALVVASVQPASAVAQYGYGRSGTGTRPAHIHVGRCPTPGEIVGPLSDVAPSVGVRVGSPDAFGVESSRSMLDMTLSELVATDHVVAVHEAHDQMETIVACGDIGGPMRSATELVLGIGPVAGSGYAGVAIIADAGEGMTVVDVHITMPVAAASPSP